MSVSPNVDQAARTASGAALKALCDWAVQAYAQPLPDAVRYRAALILLDDIGAMVAASPEPEVMAAHAIEARGSRGSEATVFAKGAAQLDRLAASVANGMSATWCELDEGYRLAPCHAAAYALPSLLAEAEATGASTGDVLRALAITYEITARFARAFPFATMTVHPHAAYATVAAGTAVAVLRKLPADKLLAAITGACSMTFAGPYHHAIDGALVRNAWTAAGSWIGFRSTDWAEAGIGGIPETAYDVYVTGFSTTCRPSELTDGLGVQWAVADGYHKVFACCQYAHSMIEAALELHERLGPDARDAIKTIVVETHPRGLTLTGTDPETVLAAKFSMPHAAAAAARMASGGQAAFSSVALHDPTIAMLRHNVVLKPYEPLQPAPNDRPARLTWIMQNGETHSAERLSARGGSDQPFDEATLIDKLAENTAATFPHMAPTLVALLQPSERDQKTWRDCVRAMTAQ